jgi:hypothetical protein
MDIVEAWFGFGFCGDESENDERNGNGVYFRKRGFKSRSLIFCLSLSLPPN